MSWILWAGDGPDPWVIEPRYMNGSIRLGIDLQCILTDQQDCTTCVAYENQAYIGYKIEKNALDGCPGIEKEGRFQMLKTMGRYHL
ncbi:hypothetical protein AgCh_036150 [Apium graveolens]